MQRSTALIIAAVVALSAPTAVLLAQPYGQHDNPLEDFLGRLGRNQVNVPLQCDTQRNIDRDGDIVWLRMECRATYRRGR
jgi:hypothetical protein